VSKLSELLPAGASGKTIEAVATATITSKKPVILNSAGTVTQVGESTTSPSMPLGTQTQFANRNTQANDIASDPHNSNRWIIAWNDDDGTDNVFLRIITLSGTTWTLSSEINMGLAGSTTRTPAVAWDNATANKIVVTYNNNSNDGSAKVGTISGSAGSETIAWGSEHTFTTQTMYASSRTPPQLLCLDSSGNYLQTFVGATGYDTTVYGIILQAPSTTITSGSETTLTSTAKAGMSSASIVPTDSTKVIFGYLQNTQEKPAIKQLSISGTSITAGSENVGATAAGDEGMSLIAMNATTTVMITNTNGTKYPAYQILTNSSGSFSFSTFTTITSSTSNYVQASNNLSGDSSVFILSYNNQTGTRYSRAKVGTINAGISSISFNTETQLSTTVMGNYATIAQQSDGAGTFAYIFEPSTNNEGLIVLGQTGGTATNLTATNYVGIADAAISTSATGTIIVQGGTVTGLSSLTTGSKYYVQADGTFGTSAGSPSVSAGLAISTTSLILNGDS